MHRNIARAYDYLQREHDRVRAAYVRILAQKDRALERQLFRANLDSPRHLDEILLYEERLSLPTSARFGHELKGLFKSAATMAAFAKGYSATTTPDC
jgi:hypothetical protein